MGIPVQCSPKGNKQLLPFSLWYPTANYRQGKWNSWNGNGTRLSQQLLKRRCDSFPNTDRWVQAHSWGGTHGRKVKPELVPRPAPGAARACPASRLLWPETNGCQKSKAVESYPLVPNTCSHTGHRAQQAQTKGADLWWSLSHLAASPKNLISKNEHGKHLQPHLIKLKKTWMAFPLQPAIFLLKIWGKKESLISHY